ncbi:MAG: bifunctional molybdenum cofactor biosynthesis protein MoaC/MoaB [Armatimonadota bacterium]
MRDISRKFSTLRTATAQASLIAAPDTLACIRRGEVPKGDPLPVAKVAAIQAAKDTSRVIPYCHPLPIEAVDVTFELQEGAIITSVTVKAVHKTGVEMEALTAASVAALTLYDMLKMIDESMEILGVKLLEKRGGKSDFRNSYDRPLRAAVLVMSDSIAAGEKDDRSGKLIVERLEAEGFQVGDYLIIPDDTVQIRAALIRYADIDCYDLVLTTGGTGFSHRDNTPEAMREVIERDIPGIPEALRNYGQDRTPYAMLSRGKAGLRGDTIIVNLPGSSRGVAESLDALFPGLMHAFGMLWGYSGHADGKEQQ